MTYHALRTGPSDGPVVFTFHGTGADETQLHGLAGDAGLRTVSPRGDVSEAGAARFFRRTGEGVYDMEDLARRRAAMADFLTAEKGDAPSAAGVGYSNGANILAAVAFERPEIVETLILMHPLIPWTPDPQPGLAGRRVVITAGRRDPICPADQTQRLADWFDGQRAEVELIWHDGGHEVRQVEVDAVRRVLTALAA